MSTVSTVAACGNRFEFFQCKSCDGGLVFFGCHSASFTRRRSFFHWLKMYHFVRGKVEEGSVDLLKFHTKENMADMLTTSVNNKKFERCRSAIGLAKMLAAWTINVERMKDYSKVNLSGRFVNNVNLCYIINYCEKASHGRSNNMRCHILPQE